MKRIKLILLAVSVLFVAGCEDKLELEPAQSLSTAESLADLSGLQTALFGAYDGLQSTNYYGRNYVVIPEVGGDNVYISINNSNRFLVNYRYELNAASTQATFWNQAYAVILRANNIITSIDDVEGEPAELNQIEGEALALRALAHFDLVRFFAQPYADGPSGLGVPIKLDAEITEPARNTIEEVYTQVISDLTSAMSLMNSDEGSFRFSSDAAQALLARVYLYKEDWANAESAANALITSGNYSLVAGEDLQDYWTTSGNSGEIFTIKRQPDETLGSDNLGQIYNPQGYGDIRVTTDIFDSYEDGDARKDLIYENADELYVGKFLEEESIPGLVSVKVLRIEEMYLIRAEARAEQSKFSEAMEDVNAIRTRVGASELMGVANSEVLGIVYNEKNLEFAFEGHRTFDLWRTERPLTRIQCNTGIELTAPCFIDADSYLRVYPIPQAELDVNQNMVQNDGY